MTLDYFEEFASKINEIPKPGLVAQLKMAPPQRFGTKETLINVPKDVKKAAVLMLLYPGKNNVLHFCLIQRSTYAGSTLAKSVSQEEKEKMEIRIFGRQP